MTPQLAALVELLGRLGSASLGDRRGPDLHAADSKPRRLIRRYAVAPASGAADCDVASVTISCTDPVVLRLTDQLLGSAFAPTRPDRSAWRIDVVPVSERDLAPTAYAFAGALAVNVGPAGALTSASRTEPAQQATVLRVPTERGALLSTDGHRTVIMVDQHARTVRAFMCRAQSVRVWGPQLVRQVLTWQLREAGAQHAHAAAVTINGTGVLLAGPHGSGKTIAALACLRLLGADLLSDGRALLTRPDKGGGLVVRPWPTTISIGSGTLLAHPSVRVALGAPDPRSHTTGHPVRLDTARAGLLLAGGRLHASMVSPRLLMLPELAFDRGPDIRAAPRIDPDTIRRRLLRTRLFLIDPGGIPNARVEDWLFDPIQPTEARPITPHLRGVIDALTELDCHRLYITRDPAGISRQLTELLPTSPLRRAS